MSEMLPVFEKYVSKEIPKDRQDSTANSFKDAFRKFTQFLHLEGINSWESFEVEHIHKYVEFLREENYRDLTIDIHTSKLAKFADDSGRNDIAEELRSYKFDKTTLIEEETGKEVTYLTTEQYMKIVEACETTREELIIRCLWETGVRRSELAEMTRSRIDREDQIFRVINKKISGTRPVPYSSELKPVLSEWLDFGGREQYSTADESDRLLISMHDSKVRGKWINDKVREIADRTEVSYSYSKDAKNNNQNFPTAHDFRRSYATHRASSGLNLKKLSRMLGHKQVETTAKYVGVKTEDLKNDNERHRPKSYDVPTEFSRNI